MAEGIRRRAGISIERCIQHWIRCARKQMENERTLQCAIKLSYEELSEDPEGSRQKLLGLIPELDDVDLRKEVTAQTLEGRFGSRS